MKNQAVLSRNYVSYRGYAQAEKKDTLGARFAAYLKENMEMIAAGMLFMNGHVSAEHLRSMR